MLWSLLRILTEKQSAKPWVYKPIGFGRAWLGVKKIRSFDCGLWCVQDDHLGDSRSFGFSEMPDIDVLILYVFYYLE